MGKKAISLSISDQAGQTMLKILRDKGFKQIDEFQILKQGDIILIVVQPLIVPEKRYHTPRVPNPYPEDYDRIASKYNIEYIVIASRHWAQSGKPCLTVHPTGNFGIAQYGGNNYELQLTSPQPMRNIYNQLNRNPPKGYSVSLEATHHSPTQFKTPLFFAEIGSRESQWRDVDVCEYLIEAVLSGIESKDNAPVAIGFGGGHYCPKFSKKMQDYAMGHIAAKYVLDQLTSDLTEQMIQKSPNVKIALTDNLKGYQKKKIQVFLKKFGIPLE